MKSFFTNPTTSSTFFKISTLFFLSLSLLFFRKLFSSSSESFLLPLSPSTTTTITTTTTNTNFTTTQISIPLKPTTQISSPTKPTSPISNPTKLTSPISYPPLSPPQTARPAAEAAVERMGIVDENGIMTADFMVGEFDPGIIESVANESARGSDEDWKEKSRVRVWKFGSCDESMRDYIPCLDNVEVISELNSTERGEKYKRHCPKKGLNCLVPRPKRYKIKIPWPQSRDEVWFNNLPQTPLVEDKEGQNWISRKNDKFIFPRGKTQFVHGVDRYLDQISKMVPDIAFGQRTRVVLDVGCGVASFGAFLLDRNVTTLSIAPKDVHKNQIQFALERGVPAMVAAFATQRLLYPSQAFDLIHCSSCRINWTHNDGILLLEANRVLRAGGHFVWAAQPVHKHEDHLQQQWKEMEDLTGRICWELLKKEGYIAIWRKTLNNSCYLNRRPEVRPPLCDTNNDPDNVWYVDLEACITRLPENYGANVTTWPARLHNPSDRLFTIKMDAYLSRKEIFKAESKYCNEIVQGYVNAFHLKELNLRNVMDMRAGYGGFAAGLHDHGFDSWVMNVVPTSGYNTLPVIYDRGLIGVMHDWCEPFDTYPRTYDLLSAAGLFSVERKRCNISTIMLEMDRILRPGGRVYIRDSVTVIDELRDIANAMGWSTLLFDTGEGPHASWKLLFGEKRL